MENLKLKEIEARLDFLDAEVYLNYKEQEALKAEFEDLIDKLVSNGVIKTRPKREEICEDAHKMYEEAMNRLCAIRGRLRMIK